MDLRGTDLERTMNLLGLRNDPTVQDPAKKILAHLGDYPCSVVDEPTRIERGASVKQIVYLSNLAGLSVEDTGKLYMVLDLAGGLSSQQAHFLIERLKVQKSRSTETR